jgi:uncharacterized membrane protein YcaP (DUF421 family)
MDTVIRVAFVYACIMIGLKVVGKREFSEMGPMDLIVLLLIPELVSQALVGDDYSMTNALVAVSTLLGLVLLVSVATYLSPWAERAVEGSSTVLVEYGRVLEKSLAKERVTPDELMSQVRQAGLETMQQVKWAILENDGKISVIAYK